ncbi:MAG: flagellar basal body rod protein FlgC [Verrucomicrobiota bacterium]|jgi:flagellar basal-body rod protein FlgC
MIQFIPSLPSTTAALDAERTRLEVIAQNIANANTTRGLDGHPYQRQQAVFQSVLQRAQAGDGSAPALLAPQVTRIQKDPRPGRALYQPGHPDADANGMVQFPNVNLYEEMADMIVASRTYEANLAVLKNGRTMALQALSIGKH